MKFIRTWWQNRLIRFYYGPKITQAWAWKLYQMGMTGHGTTPYDTAPDYGDPYPSLPPWLRKMIDDQAKIEKHFRSSTWKQSVEEICGPE